MHNLHLVNRLGYILESTQEYTAEEKIPIQGSRVHNLLQYPSEADTALMVLRKVIENDHPEYITYHIGTLEFLSIIIPAFMLPYIVEVHEIQITSWNQRMAAIRYLEGICADRWRGPLEACKFRKVSNVG